MADTDRELLELAAKAAGVFLNRETTAAGWPEFEWQDTDEPTFDGECLCGTVFWYGEDGELGGTERLKWNPLTDDGDALRLAVKLGIALDRTTNRCWAWANGWDFPGVCEEFYKEDPYAATRRAIVRAAAELGRAHG